ncbi:hypothetical protein BH23BAC2_BH23BAC2_21070 [soil metagenome]
MLQALIDVFFRAYLWELIASIAGAYYLINGKDIPFINRLLVYFLWFTFLVDLIGFYPLVAYYSDYKILSFVKGTRYAQNYWLYNPLMLLGYIAYISFFLVHLKKARTKKILKMVTVIFVLITIINFIFSGLFFIGYSAFVTFVGSLILLVTIGTYFYQVLHSDEILEFYKGLPFYVGVGALLWHLCITPLFLYNKYGIMNANPEFVQLYMKFLTGMNVVLYVLIASGFIIEVRKNARLRKASELL